MIKANFDLYKNDPAKKSAVNQVISGYEDPYSVETFYKQKFGKSPNLDTWTGGDTNPEYTKWKKDKLESEMFLAYQNEDNKTLNSLADKYNNTIFMNQFNKPYKLSSKDFLKQISSMNMPVQYSKNPNLGGM